MKRNKKVTDKLRLKILSLAGLLLGFQAALVLYILPSYLLEKTETNNLEIFFLISYLASFYVLLNMHYLVKRYGKSVSFLLFLGMRAVSLLLIVIFSQSMWSVIFVMWAIFAEALVWVGLDILVENYSHNRVTGKIRGRHLTMMNIGYFLAPFISAKLIDAFGIEITFFFSAIVTMIVMGIVLIWFRNMHRSMRKSLRPRLVFRKMWQRRNIFRMYYVAFLLAFFYATTTVYVPLYLINQGISWTEFGILLTIMLTPFIIFQYPTGILSDKIGEKEMLMVAIIIMSIFTAAISFTSGTSIVVWAILLFMGRTGAAIIEVGRDSYFYKKIGPKDVDLIDFFRTSKSVAFIVSMTFFGLLLLFIPVKSVFLILAIIVATGLIPLWKLKDTR